jgi:hypothetical protein
MISRKALLTKAFLLIACFTLLHNQLSAQTTRRWFNMGKRDTMVVADSGKNNMLHSPTRATILSAVLPGLGQAYNHKYWKIPIVYAALGTTVYLVNFNVKNYNLYHRAYILASLKDTVNDPFHAKYTPEQLNSAQEYYRRNRDLSYVFTAIFYILNIIDANVDAHLFYFNVNDDLSFKIAPELFNTYAYGQSIVTPGLSFRFTFK